MAIIINEIENETAVETPQQRRTKNALYLLVGFLVLTGLVIYFGFFKSKTPDLASSVSEAYLASSDKLLFEELKNVKGDKIVFGNRTFKNLILSDKLPVVVGEQGRDNPFAPF
ncbi:MAG: hypothetical protein AAB724_02175 [Patescibacteria group bacterium]